MRVLALSLALLLAGCATTPHAWQSADGGLLAPAEEVAACQTEADREAQRSVMLQGWGGVGYPGWWGRSRVVPGWGLGMGWSPGLAIAQRSQELMAFCMRIKGYAWLPVAPQPGPRGDAAPRGTPRAP